MKSFSTESIKGVLARLQRAVGAQDAGLSLFILPHHRGQLQESLVMEEEKLVHHPAGPAIRDAIKKTTAADGVCYQGLACVKSGSATSKTAIITVNLDDYTDEVSMVFDIYRAVWQCLYTVGILRDVRGGMRLERSFFPPHVGPGALPRINARADIFACILLHMAGQGKYAQDVLLSRARDVLRTATRYRPEEVPTFQAFEAYQHIVAQLGDISKSGFNDLFKKALSCAEDVNIILTDESIDTWVAFAGPAQDLAWRGFMPEQILKAAINMATDSYVRALAYKISEILSIDPRGAEDIDDHYNSFIALHSDSKAHLDQVRLAFDETLEEVLRTGDSAAFYRKAGEQNNALLKGYVFGWCAHALQCAARAYDGALNRGHSPVRAARLEFEVICGQISWETLQRFADVIVEGLRMQAHIGLAEIAYFCRTGADLEPILQSIEITLNEAKFRADNTLDTLEGEKMAAPTFRAYDSLFKGDTSLEASLSLSGFQNAQARAASEAALKKAGTLR